MSCRRWSGGLMKESPTQYSEAFENIGRGLTLGNRQSSTALPTVMSL